jgi:hypothetical protein
VRPVLRESKSAGLAPYLSRDPLEASGGKWYALVIPEPASRWEVEPPPDPCGHRAGRSLLHDEHCPLASQCASGNLGISDTTLKAFHQHKHRCMFTFAQVSASREKLCKRYKERQCRKTTENFTRTGEAGMSNRTSRGKPKIRAGSSQRATLSIG